MRSILDPAFRYVPSFATSVAETWRRFGWRPTTDEDRKARRRPDMELVVDWVRAANTLSLSAPLCTCAISQMPASNPRLDTNITALSHAA
jgi:hypothetical protein